MSLAEWTSSRIRQSDLTPLQPLWRPEADKKSRVKSGVLKLDEGTFLDWFNPTRSALELFCQPSFEDAWANTLWYTGEYLPSVPLVFRTESGEQVRIPRQLAPLVINYMGHLTDKRTAELSIYKATHDTVPEDETNNTERMTARVMKKIIERAKRINQLDDLFTECEKHNMIHGGTYVSIDRNKNAGDRLSAKSLKYEGQTEVKHRYFWHVLPWRSRSWADLPCIIEIQDIMHVEEARERFQDSSIEPMGETSLYSFQSPFVEGISPDEVAIYRTVYKPSDILPNGAVVQSTRDKVLSMEFETYPWSHGDFPVERYIDISVPGRFWPMSFYQRIKPMQHGYNTLSGLLKRYIYTVAHPKIVHERGSVNTKALGNSPSLIGVKPSARITPSIMQVKPIGPDPFNFKGSLRDEMIQFSNTHKIGLGDLPPNTRSGTMISRLRDIENQERGPQIDKKNLFMGRTLTKVGAVEADHLPLTSKKHIARVVGEWMVQDVLNLKNVKVSSQYRCFIKNGSGFSQELTGRIDEVAAIEQNAHLPLLPQEKRDIIGGVLREKHYDVITAAKYTCESHIELIGDGQKPPAPRITDDLVTHWSTICIHMQTMTYARWPDKLKEMLDSRLEQIEALIEEILHKNPVGLFAEKVKLLDGYPRIYNLTVEPADTGGAGATPQEGSMAAAQAKAAAEMIPTDSAGVQQAPQ